MALSYNPSSRNVDHTRLVCPTASKFLKSSSCTFNSGKTANMSLLQVRGRTCDQYPESYEYRGDCAEEKACTELYCLHMGSQVVGGLLGRHESVSSPLFRSSSVSILFSSLETPEETEQDQAEDHKMELEVEMKMRLTLGFIFIGSPSSQMRFRHSRR